MCLAIPARIVDVNECNAKVDIMGVESWVNIQLIENPKPGEYILVHAGCAIQSIEIDYFDYLQETYKSLLEVQQKNE
ncbi:MAG: hydrogenase assembly chaperone hypC/hupF [Clostridia bacterium]|jgi:hydrogenase expression/formation protein HypC|nr:hydrogenase assembly chaperone hypC/hupF [Clostridia bacterium]